MATTRKVMSLGIEVKLDNKGAITGIKQTGAAIEKSGKKAQKASLGFGKLGSAIGALGLTLGAAGIARELTQSTKAFAEFQQQVVNVQNITEMSTSDMAAWQEQLRQLPPSLGSATELTKGLYQALSSGISKDNAFEFLQANAKAAKGNLADLTTTISASTSVLAAFELPATEIGRVLDTMTKTVDLGKITFEQYSSNLGKAASIAANAGVTFEELSAATAQLTLGGLSVEESMTGIKAIMNATISPAEDVKEAMREYGVELSSSALKADGLVGYMQRIAEAAEGDIDVFARLFPNIRAIGPALALARKEGGELESITGQIADAGGKVERNFERMSNSMQGQLDILKNKWDDMRLTIGEKLAPVVLQLGDKLAEVLPQVADMIVNVIEIMQKWGPEIEAIATLLAGAFVVSKIVAFGQALLALQAATTLALGPFGLLAAAVAVVSLKVIEATKLWITWRKEVGLLKEAEEQLATTQGNLADTITERINEAGYSLVEFANKFGIVQEAGESYQAAIVRFIETERARGGVTEEMNAILTGHAKVLDDAAKSEKDLATATKKAGDKSKYAGDQRQIEARKTQLLEKANDNLIAMYKQQSDWLDDQEPVWDSFYKVLESGLDDYALSLKDFYDSGLITFEEFAEGIEELAGELFQDTLTDAVLEWSNTTEDETGKLVTKIEGDIMDIDVELPPIDTEEMQKDFDKHLDEVKASFTTSVSDMLGRGFMGEWDSFADLWDSLWQDLAKSMMGTMTDAFGQLLKDGNFSGEGGFLESIQGSAGIGSTIGGVGMVMQANQQGGAQGAMQGAMGGMMAGAIAGPIGMAVGAIAGGLIGYFGGEDPPKTSMALGPRNSVWSSDDANRKEEDVWAGKARTLYDKMEAAYRGIFLMFEDSGLGNMLRTSGRLPHIDTGGMQDNMSSQDMFDWLQNEALPDAFEAYYKPIFQEGLGNLGVNDATIDALFDALPDLSGDARIQFLADFVETVVNLGHSLENADWQTFKDSLGKDRLSNFVEGVTDVTDQMDLMMDSWRGMGLDDVVREVGAIGDAFDTALQGVAQMLGEIDKMRQSIQSGWAGMREDLALSQMDDTEQVDYFNDQIAFWMEKLQNATTLEGIDEANSNLMDYVQRLMGAVDPSEMIDPWSGGMTWGEYLQNIIDEASGTAGNRLDEVEDVVQEAYDQLVERLERASDALLEFEEATRSTTTTGDTVTGGTTTDESYKNTTLNVTAPLDVKLDVYIDGEPIYAMVQSQMAAYTAAIMEAMQAQPVID